MTSGDLSNQNSTPALVRPKLSLLTMFRLGLFQTGLGIMSLLTLGVLNRVMIKELAIPATIVGLTIAMNQFVSPVRIWFGQMSDARPIQGLHRTGYVWAGGLALVITALIAVQVIWQLGDSFTSQGWSATTSAWAALLGLVFALYGVAISASSTPFTALLVDISDEDDRSKLVGIVWSMLMVGIIIGAIVTSILLRTIDSDAPIEVVRAAINRVFILVPAAVLGLILIATLGVEKKYSRYADRANLDNAENRITLGKALKVLTASRQTGLFFLFLVIMTLSLFLQEPVLEPYGGEVFGMTIAQTTRLNAYWGTGTLIGLAATGFLVVPRLGKFNTTRLGCILVAACFILILLAGFTANPLVLFGALFLFGLASGITTTGALNLMLDLTAAETAGTFVGAWGLSQAIARGSAVVLGGSALDVGRRLFETPVMAYGLVFCLPVVGMSIAIWVLGKVNVEEFQAEAKVAIAQILSEEIS
ncbi:MAG: BCD family MFS transporter [Aphanocapsa sp. GSE-SYN-MK-11-07L]|jgi:BCD family chlorophyll transporter-like MFS transporter|nr:BCD family MFS transporter [Aphanocapsa sp. GSE-SYN-MK-11-07L]